MSINFSETKIKNFLKRNLAREKYRHTLRTARTAVRLAKLHGVNAGKARLAGLLHDCAKNFKGPDVKKYYDKLKLGNYEKKIPALWHAVAGAVVAEKVFGVKDRSVLNAVKRHSAAGLKMTALDEVIFLADKIEPWREYPDVRELRLAAAKSLKKATGLALKRNIEYIKASGKKLHPVTGLIYKKYRKYV
ncbi:MAG: bis(5'-nucleosyl)-tetraphosphatase (symmetrical) YqeK [Candidatus Firestonebacteria bacterium]